MSDHCGINQLCVSVAVEAFSCPEIGYELFIGVIWFALRLSSYSSMHPCPIHPDTCSQDGTPPNMHL